MSESSGFGRFVRELREREVVRVLLVYLGAAWVVIEVADLVFPRLGLADWTVTALIGLAALGVPVALVLAWRYDLTATGVRPAGEAVGGTAEPIPWLSVRSAAVAGLLVAAGAAIGFLARPVGPPTPARASAPAGSAIAVLPLANLSANPDSTLHLSDGFHRELIMQLNRAGLETRSSASVMRFRGAEVGLDSIARALRVRYVIDGAVTFSGGAARIAADLVDVGEDTSLWDESYDFELTAADIFETQSAIARQVAIELRRELSVEAIARLDAHPTGSLDAWAQVQRGVHLWQTGGDSAGLAASRAAFERAMELDSTYAAAYVGFMLTTSLLGQGYVQFDDVVEPLRSAGLRALALDPDAALDFGLSARSILSFQQFLASWDFEDARSDVEIMLAAGQDPGPFFFLLSGLGQHDRAIAVMDRRIDMNPGVPFYIVNRGDMLYQARRFEDALADGREARRLAEGPPAADAAVRALQARALIGLCLVRLGRVEEGLEELRGLVREGRVRFRAELAWALGFTGRADEARREYESFIEAIGRGARVGALSYVRAHVGAGESARAIEVLERAADDHNAVTIALGQHPDLDALRENPRFVALLDRVGVPEAARYRR